MNIDDSNKFLVFLLIALLAFFIGLVLSRRKSSPVINNPKNEVSEIILDTLNEEKSVQSHIEAEKEKLIQKDINQSPVVSPSTTNEVLKIYDGNAWLRHETIPKYIAEDFIKKTTWWLSHSSGSPVRAPKHYKRIRLSRHGWEIKFGHNYFLVGKAIERCKKVINDVIERVHKGEIVSTEDVTKDLKRVITGAVANGDGNEYAGNYPDNGGEIIFGTTSIDLNDASRFMLNLTGLNKFLCK